MAKVSGKDLKYSHFLETRAGDWRDQHCVVWHAVREMLERVSRVASRVDPGQAFTPLRFPKV